MFGMGGTVGIAMGIMAQQLRESEQRQRDAYIKDRIRRYGGMNTHSKEPKDITEEDFKKSLKDYRNGNKHT